MNTRRSPPNSYTEASFIVCTRLDSGILHGHVALPRTPVSHSLSGAFVVSSGGPWRVSFRPVIYGTSWSRSLQASRCRFLPPCAARGKDRMLSLRERVPSLTFLTALCGTWQGQDAQFTRLSPISDRKGEILREAPPKPAGAHGQTRLPTHPRKELGLVYLSIYLSIY